MLPEIKWDEPYDKIVLDPIATVALDPIDCGICAWDGVTKLRSSSDDIFSEYNRKKFDQAIDDMNHLNTVLQENDEFMKQFKNMTEYVEYFVFEAIVRLASPITGEIYGTVATLRYNLNLRNDTLMKALVALDLKGMIDLYRDGAKYKNNDTKTPLLKIMNTDRCDYNQAIIKNLQLVS